MIEVKCFVFSGFQENTYVLFDQSNECLIIDPGCNTESEVNELIGYISDKKLIPKKVVNTHGHIDHIFGAHRISNHYKIPFCLHQEDKILVEKSSELAMMFGMVMDEKPQISEFLSEMDNLVFGYSELKMLHVPGHSPGSIVFYSSESNFIIAGDVLFNGSIGRSDLPGGNQELLVNGIQTKLLTLPRSTVVYCGHGPTTTIGKEKDTNPYLSGLMF